MELLLNIFWLLLALPAIIIWRRESTWAGRSAGANSSRTFILLGCLLALLFPVVSATDDLHAMCREIEESSPAKRVLKHSAGPRSVTHSGNDVAPPALIRFELFSPENSLHSPLLELGYLPVSAKALPNSLGCRAPPAFAVL